MTDRHWRMPQGVRMPTHALKTPEADTGEGAETVLLGHGAGEAGAPHPSFVARTAIWRDHRAGLISLAEAQRRSAALNAVKTQPTTEPQRRPGRSRPPVARPRHRRPAPKDSRQYAQPMATTAARDDRLTPNAKAFLQVLRARCGKGRETTITKGTAANIMARSPRTIRRYLVDLVRFGYVELETLRNARGMHLGLVVRITDQVAPFYEEARGLAKWLAETPKALFEPFKAVVGARLQGVTVLSSKNQFHKNPILYGSKRPRNQLWVAPPPKG